MLEKIEMFQTFTKISVSHKLPTHFPNTMLNPNAIPFLPASAATAATTNQPICELDRLRQTPFFQQRFERFLQSMMRDFVGSHGDLQVILMNPPLEPTTKKATRFLGVYKQHTIVYEADRLEDPRTGYFRLL